MASRRKRRFREEMYPPEMRSENVEKYLKSVQGEVKKRKKEVQDHVGTKERDKKLAQDKKKRRIIEENVGKLTPQQLLDARRLTQDPDALAAIDMELYRLRQGEPRQGLDDRAQELGSVPVDADLMEEGERRADRARQTPRTVGMEESPDEFDFSQYGGASGTEIPEQEPQRSNEEIWLQRLMTGELNPSGRGERPRWADFNRTAPFNKFVSMKRRRNYNQAVDQWKELQQSGYSAEQDEELRENVEKALAAGIPMPDPNMGRLDQLSYFRNALSAHRIEQGRRTMRRQELADRIQQRELQSYEDNRDIELQRLEDDARVIGAEIPSEYEEMTRREQIKALKIALSEAGADQELQKQADALEKQEAERREEETQGYVDRIKLNEERDQALNQQNYRELESRTQGLNNVMRDLDSALSAVESGENESDKFGSGGVGAGQQAASSMGTPGEKFRARAIRGVRNARTLLGEEGDLDPEQITPEMVLDYYERVASEHSNAFEAFEKFRSDERKKERKRYSVGPPRPDEGVDDYITPQDPVQPPMQGPPMPDQLRNPMPEQIEARRLEQIVEEGKQMRRNFAQMPIDSPLAEQIDSAQQGGMGGALAVVANQQFLPRPQVAMAYQTLSGLMPIRPPAGTEDTLLGQGMDPNSQMARTRFAMDPTSPTDMSMQGVSPPPQTGLYDMTPGSGVVSQRETVNQPMPGGTRPQFGDLGQAAAPYGDPNQPKPYAGMPGSRGELLGQPVVNPFYEMLLRGNPQGVRQGQRQVIPKVGY